MSFKLEAYVLWIYGLSEVTPKRWTKNLSDIRDRVSLGGPQKGLAEAGMPLSKPYGTDVLVPHCRLQSSASKPLLHFHSNTAFSL